MNSPRRDRSEPPLGMSIREVAAGLGGVGERQARAWVASGAVYSFRVGRRLIVSRASFLKAVNGEHFQQPTETDQPELPKAVNGEPAAGVTPAAPAADRRALRLG